MVRSRPSLRENNRCLLPQQRIQIHGRRNPETEDHDNDGINDLDDLDDDNDGISDLIERFDGCYGTDPYDHDNDGVKDEFDYDDDNDGILEGPIDYTQGTDPGMLRQIDTWTPRLLTHGRDSLWEPGTWWIRTRMTTTMTASRMRT